MRLGIGLIVVLFSAGVPAAVLSGSYPIQNAVPGAPRTFRFADAGRNVYVIHHIGVQVCCGGLYTAPTAGASWFNRLDSDYHVSADSRVQTLDVASLDDDLLYKWWIDNTEPAHPFVADPAQNLLKQMKAGESWPEILVLDCGGKVRFHVEQEMTETIYLRTRFAVDDALRDTACSL